MRLLPYPLASQPLLLSPWCLHPYLMSLQHPPPLPPLLVVIPIDGVDLYVLLEQGTYLGLAPLSLQTIARRYSVHMKLLIYSRENFYC